MRGRNRLYISGGKKGAKEFRGKTGQEKGERGVNQGMCKNDSDR